MSDQPIIELRAVERVFAAPGGPVRALRGVSMAVPQGSIAAVVGPSGSGKTTLLNLVGVLDRPSAGELRVLGARPDRLGVVERAALRRRIGFIFQSFALLPTASAYENVELALRLNGDAPRAEWEPRVRRSLDAVGLGAWMHHRPYELSGGQQQRVAIARALVTRPTLILADEPTGDLDEATARQILALLRAIATTSGATIIMSTHDPLALEYASLVYRLQDGQLSLCS